MRGTFPLEYLLRTRDKKAHNGRVLLINHEIALRALTRPWLR
jgi:hypothetical protein